MVGLTDVVTYSKEAAMLWDLWASRQHNSLVYPRARPEDWQKCERRHQRNSFVCWYSS